jgi:hypothetical protein
MQTPGAGSWQQVTTDPGLIQVLCNCSDHGRLGAAARKNVGRFQTPTFPSPRPIVSPLGLRASRGSAHDAARVSRDRLSTHLCFLRSAICSCSHDTLASLHPCILASQRICVAVTEVRPRRIKISLFSHSLLYPPCIRYNLHRDGRKREETRGVVPLGISLDPGLSAACCHPRPALHLPLIRAGA